MSNFLKAIRNITVIGLVVELAIPIAIPAVDAYRQHSVDRVLVVGDMECHREGDGWRCPTFPSTSTWGMPDSSSDTTITIPFGPGCTQLANNDFVCTGSIGSF